MRDESDPVLLNMSSVIDIRGGLLSPSRLIVKRTQLIRMKQSQTLFSQGWGEWRKFVMPRRFDSSGSPAERGELI